MSSDRRCMMSDLRSAENRLKGKIAAAEAVARRARSNVRQIKSDIKKTQGKVKNLASDVKKVSRTVSKQQRQISRLDRDVAGLHGDVDDLSDELSSQRRHIYQIDGEIAGLQAQQQADRHRIEANKKLITGMQQDIAALDQNVMTNRQAINQAQQYIQVLNQEIDLAQQRIDANDQHIEQLQDGVQRINTYLEEERQRQEAERQAKKDDIAAQAQLASELRAQLEPARVRFFGAYSEYLSALTLLDQAAVNQQKGNLEAAIAQYQQGQAALMKVARDVDERERIFEDKRAQCKAAVEQLSSELALLDNENMQTWYPAEYAQLHKRFEALQDRFVAKHYEDAGEPVEVRAALDQLMLQTTQIYQDIRMLETKLLETLTQHETRKTHIRDIMGSLRSVWDQSFDYELNFLNEDDPKSTLKLQTQRPNAPNVTVYADLDGTLQFSWTGYEGMKCLDDIDQFEQTMREDHHVVVELVGAPVDRPSNPNPPFDGGGDVVVYLPKDSSTTQDRSVHR